MDIQLYESGEKINNDIEIRIIGCITYDRILYLLDNVIKPK